MATVTVTHTDVVAIADDGSPVGSNAWNAAHAVLGIENVDNTSDANKPVSTAQAAAIAAGVASVSKTSIGLGNVDNTSDVNKPVSTAQAAADAAVASTAATATALKANLASPTFTGTPAAPTATVGTNTTQLATTAFVIANAVTSVNGQTGAAVVSTSPYDNKFRNAGFSTWQRGLGLSLTTTAYTADGWRSTFTGAPGGVNRAGNQRTGGLTSFALKITGAASVTGVTLAQRIESSIAAPLAGQSVTVQAWVNNLTGVTVTPKLTVRHPTTTADDFSSLTTDVSATSMQACPSASITQISATFTANTNVTNGIEITFDFGNNFGSSVSLYFFEPDIRIGSVVGPASFLNPVEELLFNQRYYYRRNEGGPTTTEPLNIMAAFSTTQAWGMAFQFPVPMRATPTIGLSSIAHLNLNGTACSAGTFDSSSIYSASTFTGLTVGSAVLTSGFAVILRFNTASGWIDASAEL